MRVLVTGGAGYIGSHTVVPLVAAGHDVVVVDNFSNTKPHVVARLEALTGATIPVHAFDLTDRDKVRALFAERDSSTRSSTSPALKAVGESVEKPLEYYQNNLDSTFSLVRAMRGTASRLVFSSSATVYGENAPVPYQEDYAAAAANPYGRTKVMIEQSCATSPAPTSAGGRAAALLQPGRRAPVGDRSARTPRASPTT